jgi:hypothetical protein
MGVGAKTEARRRWEGYIYYVTYSRTHTRKGRGQQ